MDGDLWLSMLWQSAKAADLLRDPRILVHSVVTGRDGAEGEFKVRGTARAEHDPDVQRHYSAADHRRLGPGNRYIAIRPPSSWANTECPAECFPEVGSPVHDAIMQPVVAHSLLDVLPSVADGSGAGWLRQGGES